MSLLEALVFFAAMCLLLRQEPSEVSRVSQANVCAGKPFLHLVFASACSFLSSFLSFRSFDNVHLSVPRNWSLSDPRPSLWRPPSLQFNTLAWLCSAPQSSSFSAFHASRGALVLTNTPSSLTLIGPSFSHFYNLIPFFRDRSPIAHSCMFFYLDPAPHFHGTFILTSFF